MLKRKLAAIMIALRKRGLIRPSVRKATSFFSQADDVNPTYYAFGRVRAQDYPGFHATGFPDLGGHYEVKHGTQRINFLSPSGAPVSFDKLGRSVPSGYHSRLRIDQPQGATGFQVHGPAREILRGEVTGRRSGFAMHVKPSMLLKKERVAEQVVREFEHGLGASWIEDSGLSDGTGEAVDS